ncbi:hypothetical protein C8R45DRAFT_1000278 [Mycena sanguinolenta]|nr:hypothetical protein C8R45DRAFT_1000278 [Mycena sanguinolenta]
MQKTELRLLITDLPSRTRQPPSAVSRTLQPSLPCAQSRRPRPRPRSRPRSRDAKDGATPPPHHRAAARLQLIAAGTALSVACVARTHSTSMATARLERARRGRWWRGKCISAVSGGGVLGTKLTDVEEDAETAEAGAAKSDGASRLYPDRTYIHICTPSSAW